MTATRHDKSHGRAPFPTTDNDFVGLRRMKRKAWYGLRRAALAVLDSREGTQKHFNAISRMALYTDKLTALDVGMGDDDGNEPE